MDIRSAFSPRMRVSFDTGSNSRTKQAFKAECDINNILKRYSKTGVLEHVNDAVARYGDFSGFNFNEAQLMVANAKSMFEGLPSEIRNKFDNDPGRFLAFMEDERNAEEARSLGLLPDTVEDVSDVPAGKSPVSGKSGQGAGEDGDGGDSPDSGEGGDAP